MSASLLVAGIGNIFFGDDAFGSEVARELLRRPRADRVRVEDFGIRSYDLAYALMDGADAILIDVVSRGEPPGTVYLIEPDVENLQIGTPDGHTMSVASVLPMVRSMDGRLGRLWLVGCEPSALECEEGQMGLSAPVAAAVPEAIRVVERLVEEWLDGNEFVRSTLAGNAKEVS